MNYKFIVTAVLVLNLFTQIHAIARADIVPYPISNRETGCKIGRASCRERV